MDGLSPAYTIYRGFLPVITMNFAQPLIVDDIWIHNPKKTTSILEKIYHAWTKKVIPSR